MQINIDSEQEILTIAGIKYSYGFFKGMSEYGVELNTPFQIVKRDTDGVIVVERLDSLKPCVE